MPYRRNSGSEAPCAPAAATRRRCVSASASARLGDVTTPTLLVWGGRDRIVPVECAGLYAASLQNATVEMVEDAGHVVEIEEPERVAELISRHVD